MAKEFLGLATIWMVWLEALLKIMRMAVTYFAYAMRVRVNQNVQKVCGSNMKLGDEIYVYDDKCFTCGSKENLYMLGSGHLIGTDLKPVPQFDYKWCGICPRPSLQDMRKRSLEWCAKNEIDWVK